MKLSAHDTERSLTAQLGVQASWVTMTPSDTSKIVRGTDNLKIEFENKGAKGYTSNTYLSTSTGTDTRGNEDKILVSKYSCRAFCC